MLRRASLPWIPLAALLLAACSDGGPVAPAAELDLVGDGPLAAVMPDLAAGSGTPGTERYVPALERILRRSVMVIKEKRGEEAARRVVAEAQRLRGEIRAARDAGDQAAFQEAVRKLEAFSASVGLRVFGTGLVRHVHQDAAGKLQALVARLREASEAGQDVTRFAAGARQVGRQLAAARGAAEAGRPVAALVHAARALDLVTRVNAAF